jgi:hypothetical protein
LLLNKCRGTLNWKRLGSVPTLEDFSPAKLKLIHLFIKLFNKLLLNTHCVPSPELKKR